MQKITQKLSLKEDSPMRNIGKRTLCLLCAMVMILSMIVLPEHHVHAAETTDGLDLSKMQIVLSSSATAVEKTAASELQTYVYKMTGVKPAVVTEGQQASSACVYIGATAHAHLRGITYPTEGDVNGEAWVITVKSGDLYLCGAPTRGPLYAVYHLLEDVLGVRWWNPWEEEVPKGKAMVPTDYYASGVPAMEYREIFMGYWTKADNQFRARNRMNGSIIYNTDPLWVIPSITVCPVIPIPSACISLQILHLQIPGKRLSALTVRILPPTRNGILWGQTAAAIPSSFA